MIDICRQTLRGNPVETQGKPRGNPGETPSLHFWDALLMPTDLWPDGIDWFGLLGLNLCTIPLAHIADTVCSPWTWLHMLEGPVDLILWGPLCTRTGLFSVTSQHWGPYFVGSIVHATPGFSLSLPNIGDLISWGPLFMLHRAFVCHFPTL